MTVNQIFDTIQYGEQYTKNKALKESISKYYDEDLDLFYASKRAKELSGKIVMSESEEQKMNSLVSKLVVIEDRLEDGKVMSWGSNNYGQLGVGDTSNRINPTVVKLDEFLN